MQKSQGISRAARALCLTAGVCGALGFTFAVQAEGPESHRDRMPPRGRRPPPEAFAACEGKAEGSECKVEFHGDVMEGVCIAPRSEDEVFCMPNDMPPPPPEGREPGRIIM